MLINNKGRFMRFGIDALRICLSAAKDVGWTPDGTTLSLKTRYEAAGCCDPLDLKDQLEFISKLIDDSSKGWDNGYGVTLEDANHFAHALEKVSKAVEAGDRMIHSTANGFIEFKNIPIGIIQELTDFCREGAFTLFKLDDGHPLRLFRTDNKKFLLFPGGSVEIVGPGGGRRRKNGMGVIQINFSPQFKKIFVKERKVMMLMNRNYSCDYGPDYWDALLDVARKFGWQPHGTVPGYESDVPRIFMPEDLAIRQEIERRIKEKPPTQKGYYRCSNQIITMDDASNIASALERALEEIKADEPIWDCTPRPDEYAAETITLQRTLTKDLADYCRQGPILILKGIEDLSVEDSIRNMMVENAMMNEKIRKVIDQNKKG